MTWSESLDAQRVLPQLHYEHPIEAISWLCHVFGFAEEVRMSGPNGELYIAEVVAPDGGILMIAGPLNPEAAEQPRPNLSYSITIIVPDVDAHHEQACTRGARVLVPPRDQPWGLRDYEVLDLEGRLWNFSQRIRHVEPEDWGARRLT